MNIRKLWRQRHSLFSSCCSALIAFVAASAAHAQTAPPVNCDRTVKADVVALDQVIIYNRLGAINPAGMMYALKRDIVARLSEMAPKNKVAADYLMEIIR